VTMGFGIGDLPPPSGEPDWELVDVINQTWVNGNPPVNPLSSNTTTYIIWRRRLEPVLPSQDQVEVLMEFLKDLVAQVKAKHELQPPNDGG